MSEEHGVKLMVFLNGESTTLPAATTIGVLVSDRYPTAQGIAVALDGEVVPRSTWADTVIPAGASVEVVTAVAGG
jgi:sulfur carrier protein